MERTLTYEQQRFLQGKIRMEALQSKPELTEEDKYEINGIKTELWRLIMNFAYTEMMKITRKYIRASDANQDIMQKMACIFFERLPYYDPLRSTPTTYFVRYFRQAISEYLHTDSQHVTQYDANNIRKVRAAINYYETYNIKWTEEMISLMTGLSKKVVKSTIQIANNSIRASVDEMALTLKSKIPTPEEKIIEEETRHTLEEAINRNLTEKQKELLLLRINPLGNKEISYENVAQSVGMSTREVKRELNRILCILNDDISFRRQYVKKNKEKKGQLHLLDDSAGEVADDIAASFTTVTTSLKEKAPTDSRVMAVV